jgi:hypothetical protein
LTFVPAVVYWLIIACIEAEWFFPILLLGARSHWSYYAVIALLFVTAGSATVVFKSRSQPSLSKQIGRFSAAAAALYVINWALLLSLYWQYDKPGFKVLAPIALVLCACSLLWRISARSASAAKSARSKLAFVGLTLLLAVPHIYLEPLQLQSIATTGSAIHTGIIAVRD